MTDYDVAIIGGGTVGLALALALEQAEGIDLRICVIDRQPATGPSRDPRAWAIAGGPRHLLDALGVWNGIARVSGCAEQMVISDTRLSDAVRPPLLTFGDDLTGFDAGGIQEIPAHIVPAGALNDALASAAASAHFDQLTGSMLASLSLDAEAVDIVLNDGGSYSATLIVAADGANSTVRDLAGIKTVGWDYDQTGMIATVRHEQPHHERAFQHFLPGGPFALLPLPGHRSSVVWSERRETAQRLASLDDASFLTELEMRAGPELGAYALDGPRGTFPLRLMVARDFVAHRVALVGDAAHCVHPLAGQGLNLGLNDVAALAETIVDCRRLGIDHGSEMELRRYERWRRFDVVRMAALTDGLNRAFAPDNAGLRAIRDAGLGMVDRFAGLRNALQRTASGVDGNAPKLMSGIAL